MSADACFSNRREPSSELLNSLGIQRRAERMALARHTAENRRINESRTKFRLRNLEKARQTDILSTKKSWDMPPP